LVEQFGMLDRQKVETHVRALSQKERRALKSLGVRFGAVSLYLPALLAPEARTFCAAFAELAQPDWRPAADALSALPRPAPPPEALSLRGLRALGGLAAPVAALERLDALGRAATPQGNGAVRLTPEILADLGWELAQAELILRGLGYAPVRKAGAVGSILWRRRARAAEASSVGPAASPFAALAAIAAPLAPPAPRTRRNRARRRRAS
ncbi:MAG TPA: hypothetical protein VN795_00550, partial [Stellaceae bacterium]|nr:hypothetical protein [Stellaceae bacterium]